jgi:hypothetical protein
LGACPATPAFREARGEEGRRSYSLPPASGESQRGAPLRPTPFQRRGCELPVDLLGPCGAFTESCRPLTFSLSPAGTPESESFPPDVLSYRQRVDLAAYGGLRGVDLPVKGPCFAQLVESHTGISPRTPSVVFQTYEPKPIDDALAIVCSTLEAHPHRFAFCPSAPVRQAVLRISSWLAPSLTTVRTCARPVKKTRDASNRLLPPTRITCTRTSCVPNSLRWLPSADAPRRLRLRTARLGDRMFHDTRDRFGGPSLHADLEL